MEKNSRIWSDSGVKPDPGEETYEGQTRPFAEYDNWAMWAVTKDIDTIAGILGDLESIDSITKLTFGTEAERPDPGAEGNIFIEIDTGRIVAHDGNGWDEIGVSDYTQLVNRTHGMEDHDDTVASSTDLESTQTELNSHKSDENNPHNVTESQTGAAGSLDDHASDTGGVHGVGGTDAVAGQSDIDSTVESHRQTQVHDEPQPNQTHGNEDHSETYETESGAQSRVDDHASDTGGVHGVSGTDAVAGQSDVNSTVEDHRTAEVHSNRQPNEIHGNEDHSETYETESGAQSRVDSHASETLAHGSNGDVAGTNDLYTDVEARSAIEAGNVSEVQFANVETVSGGALGRDNSVGFLGRWGGHGHAVLWDSYAVTAGTDIDVSGGKGDESQPTIAHADTGGANDRSPSASAVVDALTFDARGHATDASTSTRSIDDWANSDDHTSNSVDASQLEGSSKPQVRNHSPNSHASSHESDGGDAIDASNLAGQGSGGGFNADQVDGKDASELGSPAPIYGNGSGGSVTDSSSTTRSGVLKTTDYTLQSGNTLSVDSSVGYLVIFATNNIQINGTIDAKGVGAQGGSGSTSRGNSGNSGSAGSLMPTTAGGAGGSGIDGQNGGDGGDGDTASPKIADALQGSPTPFLSASDVRNGGLPCAGGGGGAKGTYNGDGSGNNGSFPGGGGGGGGDSSSGLSGLTDGGDGGDGGGVVLLVAPDITVSGTIDASGEDGGNSADGGATGGGGGGGNGGVIGIYTETLTENNPTYTYTGGAGGTAGSAGGDGRGGDGADGQDGILIK